MTRIDMVTGKKIKDCKVHKHIRVIRSHGRPIQKVCDDCLKVFERYGSPPQAKASGSRTELELMAFIIRRTNYTVGRHSTSPKAKLCYSNAEFKRKYGMTDSIKGYVWKLNHDWKVVEFVTKEGAQEMIDRYKKIKTRKHEYYIEEI